MKNSNSKEELPNFINTHPFIKKNKIQARIYQQMIVANALKTNTLCVLGTGLGKTAIATLTIAGILHKKGGKALIIAPSRPLVEQHFESLKKFLNVPEDEILILNGKVQPLKRQELWENGRIFISTPQVVENDIIATRLNPNDFSILVADEAHHTTGNHSYTFVGNVFREKTHILGLTASPGSNIERILEVCENLGIEHVEIRTEDDLDVKQYIAKAKLKPKRVELPEEYNEALKLLKKSLNQRLKVLKEHNAIYTINVNKTDLLVLNKKIMMMDDKNKFQLLKVNSEAIKIDYLIETLETQGKDAFLNYYDKLASQNTKSAKEIYHDRDIKKIVDMINETDIEHPKLESLLEVVSEAVAQKEKVIVFAQYRDTVSKIVDSLKERGIPALMFVGQSNKDGKGMSQKEQSKAIAKFKGEIDVLVSTSVSEEGMDISAVNYVVFYEPVPSEIRFIQRRGRVMRGEGGEVIILIAKGTRDEGYYRAAIAKEKSMKNILKDMQKTLNEKLCEIKKLKNNELDEIEQCKIDQIQDIKKYKENKEIEKTVIIDEKEESKPKYLDLMNVVKSENVKKDEKNKKEDLEKLEKLEKVENISNETLKAKNAKNAKIATIIVDTRERGVGRYFLDKANVEFKTLEIGDYILSDRVAIERKTAEDFEGSIIDKRLFKQLGDLKKYEKPLLIIEGDEFYRLNKNAITGMILSIMVDYGIPIIFTKNVQETVDTLVRIAEREQLKEKRPIAIRYGKRPMSTKERQKFLVEGLPDVGPIMAENLLTKFDTVEEVFTASERELMAVEGVGEITAKNIRKVVTNKFSKPEYSKNKDKDDE
ncbi:Fanconi anemia group M protein [Methanococcus voltae]|uniref:Fanconi anemia group M protein n=3 Tax=Methanococcus voltae TaxID=2188 RepID=A0A8J7URX2_METVO|nr:DEAD/DEAH box helicase [Methanococcus voltae]MBP2172003.1 Fanconi anemia group M protein [Methanococcus voltae]MBP2201042.1 Fanconi anemia group M protein [Methanococcus voltae]MCS3921764.1 Fanconi anemia group M protein [Methanococcus voltae PS]